MRQVPPGGETCPLILFSITQRRDSPQQLVRRSRIVLLAAEGLSNTKIAQKVTLYQNTVRTWWLRWIAQQEKGNY